MPLVNNSGAMLFWVALALVPLGVSVAYLGAAPRDRSLVQRLITSAHGAALSVLWLGALLVGVLGTPLQSNWEVLGSVCLLPLALIVHSLWQYGGSKWVHALQLVNVVWLLALLVFGRMAVTGVWL